MIYVVGLGPGGVLEMSAEALGALRRAKHVFLRTERHPAIASLRIAGIEFQALDELQPSAESMLQRAQQIADCVLSVAREMQPVAYAVPGHPLIAEDSVRILLEGAHAAGIPVRLVPSRSFLEPVLEAVGYTLSDGLQVIDASSVPRIEPNPCMAQIYYQVEDVQIAAALKAMLLRFYPESFEVTLVHAAGVEGHTEVLSVPLNVLDRQRYDPLTSLFVLPTPYSSLSTPGLDGLVGIVATLRGPNGCPWDKEQTHETLKPYLIEEAYEALEAIDSGSPQKLCEELGDVLLQVVMHAQFAAEAGRFDMKRVITQLSNKLVRRHPHVFGDMDVANADEVLRNWDTIKSEEQDGTRSSILEGIPKSLPALLRALTVSKRAARAGFEWANIEGVLEKLQEEEIELHEAIAAQDDRRIHDELGDLLFTVVNVARHAKVNPEESLRLMVERFINRFRQMEQQAALNGQALNDLSPDEWEALWEQAKRKDES
jgi:tetrapyrrole methylase family protein/MazG family protein